MAARKRAGGLAALLMTAALVAASPMGALAAEPAPSASASPGPVASASASPASTAAAAAAARRLAARVVALQRVAETKGKAAEEAGEKANLAKSASDAAARERASAEAAATAAAATAAETRARASAVAAQLARTDLGTLPLDLMLNGRSAEGILGGLSTSSQLSAQSQLLFDQARAQQIESARMRTAADAAASAAAAAAKTAARDYAAAKKQASTAKTAVDAALAEQAGLLASSGDEPAVCASIGTAPVAACLPAAGAAPAGTSVGARVVRFATAQIGKPYVFAAAGPDAYDCSGLTLAAYASAGVAIGTHSATNQYDTAKAGNDLVPLADAKPGDLLFYTDGGGDMYHVTIYAGNGLMLEAPYPGATVRAAPIRSGDLVAQVAHFG